MLKVIRGIPGSGKTARITGEILRDTAVGRQVYLIVPEQEAVSAEARMTEILPPSAQLSFEVVNFTRLANKVFRTYGGLSYKYLTPGMKNCLMWRAVRAVSESSETVMRGEDRGFVALMLSAVEELKRSGVTGENLISAADAMSENRELSAKIRDLALLSSVYSGLVTGELSDPTDDVGKLAEILEEHDFFAGTKVYIDSFSDFTASELAAIGHIARTADSLTVTLPGNGQRGLPVYLKSDRTAATLHKTADFFGVEYEEEILTENRRGGSADLKFLAENLFVGEKPAEISPDRIEIRAFSDRYSEIQWVAADICRILREEGASYKDFAVIARNLDSLAGTFDGIFSKYGLPMYLSKPTEILSKPIAKLIFSAFSVLRYGWRADDVMSYIKTGLAGIDSDGCDELDSFCRRWKISGTGFSGDMPWSMNPDGLVEEFTDSAAERLGRLNDLRERVRRPLLLLSDAFSGGRPTVKEAATALFGFLSELEIPSQINRRVEKLRLDGRLEEAAESVQLWNVTLDALDRLTAVSGDETVSEEEFCSLFTVLLTETKIGALPQSSDAVTVGSALSLRASDIKYAYLVGCERGVFPAAATESGYFGDAEKIALEGEGIFLSPTSENRAGEELFYFLRAAALPTDRLFLSYSSGGDAREPSPALGAVSALFGGRVKTLSGASDMELLYTEESVSDALSSLSDESLRRAAEEILPDESGVFRLDRSYPMVTGDCSVSPETAARIFPRELHLTQSRLEKFVRCPFAYYCEYVLRADGGRDIFDYADIGSFMHKILELTLSGGELGQVVDDYMKRVCPREKLESARIKELFSRLRKTAELLISEMRDEFAQSEFKPVKFEYKVGYEPESTLAFPLPDGSTMALCGIADRVDAYCEDGRAYIRIVDYKTGKKTFALSDISEGINLQLLIYLFSMWKKPQKELKKELEADEILPAGILYFGAREPELSLSHSGDTENLGEREKEALSRSGLFINDENLLRAMDRELEGRFLPVKLKNGVLCPPKDIKTVAEFGALYNEVSRIITEIGIDLKSGRADAAPKKDFAVSANRPLCDYCSMHTACRRARNAD